MCNWKQLWWEIRTLFKLCVFNRLDDDIIFNEDGDDSGDDMEMDPTQIKPKKEAEKEKSSLTERLEVAMSSLVTVFPETDLDFLVSIEEFFQKQYIQTFRKNWLSNICKTP